MALLTQRCAICGEEKNNDTKYCEVKTCGSKSCAAKLYHINIKKDLNKVLQRSIRQSEITRELWKNKRDLMLSGIQEWHKTEEAREFHSKNAIKNWKNIDFRENMSRKSKERWSKEDFRNKTILKIITAMSIVGKNNSANKTELLLLDYLQKNKFGNFEYIGNFKKFINGKNPDFIDETNKKIIELYGHTWHKNDLKEKTKERIDLFKRAGYDTLIVWDFEIRKYYNSDLLHRKIEEFVNGRT
jgi:G:T-mismatch repair DNA endonuclease (very short patch repair protein)